MSRAAKRIRSVIVTIVLIVAANIAIAYASSIPILPDSPKPGTKSSIPILPDSPKPGTKSSIPILPDSPKPGTER